MNSDLSLFSIRKNPPILHHPLRMYNIIWWIMYGNIQFNTLNLFIFFVCAFFVFWENYIFTPNNSKKKNIGNKNTKHFTLEIEAFVWFCCCCCENLKINCFQVLISTFSTSSLTSLYFVKHLFTFQLFYKLFICNKV